MKNFEMPTLYMMETPMSESIASACCYSETVNGLTTTKKVLNGGTIGTHSWYTVYPDVIRFFGGIATAPSNHYTYYYQNIDDPAQYNNGAVWISGGPQTKTKDVAAFTQSSSHTLDELWTITDGTISQETIEPGSFVKLTNSGCDHLSQKCPFNEKTTIDFVHTGAKYPHALGAEIWQYPHPAAQYNS
ncbi:MAG: hypothetical protein LBS72_00580 [Oscillospiraceae bacterium]|jgi:hypothetical protein|nr:hypothetical protein [Oscillospiraceae bacterium]